VKTPCSSCNQRLEIPEELAGQTIECPACNASLAVPAIAASKSVPAQVQQSAPQAASSKKSKSSAPKWTTFQYEAINPKNYKNEKGELPAASQADALARLHEMGVSPGLVEQAMATGRLADKAKREHYELLRREKKKWNWTTKPKKFLIGFVGTIVVAEVFMIGHQADFLGHLCIILFGMLTGLMVSQSTDKPSTQWALAFKGKKFDYYVVRDATGKPIETIDLPEKLNE